MGKARLHGTLDLYFPILSLESLREWCTSCFAIQDLVGVRGIRVLEDARLVLRKKLAGQHQGVER